MMISNMIFRCWILCLEIIGCFLIAAVADAWAADVTLSWDQNVEPELAGYRIYYGTARGSYSVQIDVCNVTKYKVTGLMAGKTYYFAATAYDTSGYESGYSTQVIYSVPSTDADGDGLPNEWESVHNLNWMVDDALEDRDNDGFSNLREYLSGSDPEIYHDQPSILADPENDNDVDGTDLSIFIEEFGRTDCDSALKPCEFDFDTDGDVDVIDLRLFIEDYGRSQNYWQSE